MPPYLFPHIVYNILEIKACNRNSQCIRNQNLKILRKKLLYKAMKLT